MKRPHKLKKSRTKKVIAFRPSLFWDVNPKNIDPKKNARYIIERILDFGTDKEVQWMAQYYSRRAIKGAVDQSRILQMKSKTLWSLVFP